MEQVLLIAASAIVAIAVVIGIAIAIQWKRISKFLFKAGLQGLELSVELDQVIKREVRRATAEAVSRMARLDVELIEYWEREYIHKHEDSKAKLDLLESHVVEAETAFRSLPDEERPDLGLALRELYWLYLKQARDHYASSPPYHQIKSRVVSGLTELKKLQKANG